MLYFCTGYCATLVLLFIFSEANIFTVSFAFVLVLDLSGKLFSCAYFTMLNIQVVDVCKNIL